jgi:y4mF family transcriptional regulator
MYLILQKIHIKMGKNQVGTIVRARRKELGVTQLHLAELAGVNVNTIYNLEYGEGNLTLNVLSKVLNVLGLEIKLVVKDSNL